MASKFQIPIAFKSDPRGLKEAESAVSGFGKKLAGIGALVGAAFAIRGLVNFGKEAVLAAESVATANNTLIAVAKATQVFGSETDKVTGSLIQFAKAQEMRIGVDENVVKGVQAQLLSFKALSVSAGEVNGVFERTTKVAFDMATVMKKDVGSQAIALGKALEDPVRGLTALRRGGTVFTAEQENVIKALVDSNDLLGAQTLILNELESQYGGAAEASANWSDKTRLAFENIKESVGAALTPAFEAFAKFLIEEVIPPVTKFFDEDFPRFLVALQPVVDGVIAFLNDVGESLKGFLDIDEDTSLIEGILEKLAELKDNPEFIAFIDTMGEIFEEIGDVLPGIVTNLGSLALKLDPLLKGTLQNVIPLARDFGTILDGIDFFLGEIIDSFGEFEVETPGFLSVLDRFLNPMARLQVAARAVADAVNAVVDALQRVKDAGGKPLVALMQSTFDPTRGFQLGSGRAVGGPVSARDSFLVGERGPEIFTPGVGGFITPNNRLGGGGGSTYNITVNAGMGSNGAQLGEQIVNAIKRYERSSGPVFASA
jgi:hypothetical protein